MDRRTALLSLSGGAAAMLGGCQTLTASGQGARPNNKVDTDFLSFDSKLEEFEAHFRIERDLVADQGETVNWYFWMAYIVPDGHAPQPFVRNEGIEYSYFRKVAANTYRIHAHNISYPRSLQTNKYADVLENPITGKLVQPKPVLLLNDPGTVHSPDGFRNLSGTGSYVEPYRQFRVQNDQVKLDSVRTAPPDWPVKHMESSTQWASLEAFNDKSLTNVPSRATGVYIFPYPEWLEMGDIGGHMLGYWDSVKLPRISDIPDEFLSFLENKHPELLRARWEDFDRPSPFAY